MKIAVAGLGYVGLSLACLLAKNNSVVAIDIDEDRIDKVNAGLSPISDALIESYLASKPTSLYATSDAIEGYGNADIVIIATPTNYDDKNHCFDTSSIESVIDLVNDCNPEATIIIKSTIPVGYTEQISNRYPNSEIIFSPEFLREGHALEDNLKPSRIIVGITSEEHRPDAERFATLLSQGAEVPDVPILIMGSTEAEAVKLFANTYLALRVSFFNELDTYAQVKGLDTGSIIEGICLDPRIGNFYNNPSFGYGGYCLPKDSKQLLSNYEGVPQDIIRAVVSANATRKKFIAQTVLEKTPKKVGVFRLAMKSGSDNFRQSSSLGVIDELQKRGAEVLVYEPAGKRGNQFEFEITDDLPRFKNESDVILANRWDACLEDVRNKVYTCDLWNKD